MPETELKFDVTAGDLKRLAKHPAFKAKAQRARLRAAYFDTPELTLRNAGLDLRVRTADGRHVQTVKAAAGEGLFDRDEWETVVAGKSPDIDALADTPAARRLNGDADRLQPVFETAIDRGVRLWTPGDAAIEISVDRGEIKAGSARDAVLELELELKSGPKEALYALAEELVELAPLRLSFASKSDRGYRLAAGQAAAAVKAEPVVLSPESSVGEALKLVMRSCLSQLSANVLALRHSENPDILHQARIGLRRLRAALSLFKAAAADEGHAWLRSKAQWIARELNAARDLDVLLQGLDPKDPAFGGDPSVAKFVQRGAEVRSQAYASALTALESPRFAQFMLKTALWVEAGPWARDQDTEGARLRDGLIPAYAAARLERLFKTVRKEARHLERADEQTRHDVRIRAKKLRYATEFFAGAFPGQAKRRIRFEAAVKSLQDALGVLNDLAIARESALRATGGSRSPELSFAAGLVVARLRRSEPRALRKAVKAAAELADTRRFWS